MSPLELVPLPQVKSCTADLLGLPGSCARSPADSPQFRTRGSGSCQQVSRSWGGTVCGLRPWLLAGRGSGWVLPRARATWTAVLVSSPSHRPTVLPSCKAWVGPPRVGPPPAHHLDPQRCSGSWLGGLRRPRPSAGAVVPGCLHGAVFQVEGAGVGGSCTSSGLRQLLAGTLVCTAY